MKFIEWSLPRTATRDLMVGALMAWHSLFEILWEEQPDINRLGTKPCVYDDTINQQPPQDEPNWILATPKGFFLGFAHWELRSKNGISALPAKGRSEVASKPTHLSYRFPLVFAELGDWKKPFGFIRESFRPPAVCDAALWISGCFLACEDLKIASCFQASIWLWAPGI